MLWATSPVEAPLQQGDPTDGAGNADSLRGSPAPPVPAGATAPASLKLVPGSTVLTPGQPVVVRVVLGEGASISSVPFHLKFNPEVLQYVTAREGALFRSTSLQPVLLASVNPNRPGDLAVGLSMIESSGLLNGSGGILEIEFRALAPGQSELLFDRASVRGPTGAPLPVELLTSSVAVR